MWNSHFYDNEYNITIHFYDLKKRRPSLPDIDNDSRVWNCVPNREYCQQIIRTENSMQILTSCLLTERHHSFKTNWLKSEKRRTARKGEFFKSNMDAMTVLSMWDTVLNESSLTETSILLIEFHFLQRKVSLDLNLMIVSVWQWSTTICITILKKNRLVGAIFVVVSFVYGTHTWNCGRRRKI